MEEVQASRVAEIEAAVQKHVVKLNKMSDHTQTAKIEVSDHAQPASCKLRADIYS